MVERGQAANCMNGEWESMTPTEYKIFLQYRIDYYAGEAKAAEEAAARYLAEARGFQKALDEFERVVFTEVNA